MPLLEVEGLRKVYPGASVPAVAGASLAVDAGATVGIVGESGSGKSTLIRCLLGLVKPDAGTVTFDGQDFLSLRRAALRKARGGVQLVPQHPESSLNPRMTVGGSIEFNLRAQRISARDRRRRVGEMLGAVGLPERTAQRYPRELSGGQIQRVAIGRALATSPKLVVCDEAVSALDKSVQAQILNLLVQLQTDLGVAYLFISHDLSVIEHISDQVVVMRSGHIVETGPTTSVWNQPQHDYTKLLLNSLPGPHRRQQRTSVPGGVGARNG